MVGAVLVHQERIIGEGFHQAFGQAHAEVNCIGSVKPEDRHLIGRSVLYVSLEPCSHFGKTPPCADLIIREGIPRVVIATSDPNPRVDGRGIAKLRAAGTEVAIHVLKEEAEVLNKRFFTYQKKHRPYVILKWAQSQDGKIAARNFRRTPISNAYTNRVVHKWRSEEMSILVGTNTALFDDPSLTTRLWPGKNPLRLVVDMGLRLPYSLKLFDGTVPTIVFNEFRHEEHLNLSYYQVGRKASLLHQVLNALAVKKIQSVLVEGGAQLLQTFIDEDAWDEARIITNGSFTMGPGLYAPVLKTGKLIATERILSDSIQYYKNPVSAH
jgi:diaminohydroxyphosphoribosylaminopyrimidine deaminase/5-amino-6-(5-phosphoribosylamino)uracil reductase